MHSVPSQRHCSRRRFRCCATSNSATTRVPPCNASRRWALRVRRVDPTSLSIEGGLSPKGCVLNVGESGLSTRLFTPVASLCPTPVTIEGRGSLLRRPMQMMFEPLRRLGVGPRQRRIPPHRGLRPDPGREAEVDGSVSSQFITGLLLALPLARRDTSLHVHGQSRHLI